MTGFFQIEIETKGEKLFIDQHSRPVKVHDYIKDIGKQL